MTVHTFNRKNLTMTKQLTPDSCEVEFVDERKVKRVQTAMKSDDAVVALAETFKLLGDPTRMRIAVALSCEELCVCDLANLLGMSQSAVSHSLRALRQMKLVRFRREGKIAYYALDDDHIASLLKMGFRHVEELL
jgi:ArsR family transcriptional regulator, lead/cadmium/zinc/bismuth-responsive transcriptional repressor